MLCCRLWEAASRFLAPQPERACSLAGTWIGGLPPARCRSAVPRYAWAHWGRSKFVQQGPAESRIGVRLAGSTLSQRLCCKPRQFRTRRESVCLRLQTSKMDQWKGRDACMCMRGRRGENHEDDRSGEGVGLRPHVCGGGSNSDACVRGDQLMNPFFLPSPLHFLVALVICLLIMLCR
jgi:hypothetical protein